MTVYGYNLKPPLGNTSYSCLFGRVRVVGEWVTKGTRVLHSIVVCCSVLQCVAAAVLAACASVNGSPKVRVCCRETLQHTATHCYTLQHTATHSRSPTTSTLFTGCASRGVPPEPTTPSINTHHSRIYLPVCLRRLPVPLCMRMRAHVCASVCICARATHTRAWYVMKRRCVQRAKRRVL